MKGKDGQLIKGNSAVPCMVTVVTDIGIIGINGFDVTNFNLTCDAH
jgi:hypothetical protein